jgi:hypothetical protein
LLRLTAALLEIINQSMEVPFLAPISISYVHNATERLRPTTSVGLDCIPTSGSSIKGCSEIFVLVLKFVFNLSLSQNTLPKLWMQAAVFHVFKEGKQPLLEIIGP